MKKNYLGDIRPMTHVGGAPKRKIAAAEKNAEREIAEEEVAIPVQRRSVPPPAPPRRERVEEYEEPAPRGHSWGRIGGFLALGLLVAAGALYGLSFMFRGAIVTVTPKHISGVVDLTLTAGQEDSAELHFEVMSLPETVTKDIVATDTQSAKLKASGTVVLYNFQSTSQELVATTRFADPSGQVFRLPKSVSIPRKTVSGGKDVPGQLTVTLVADAAGPEGNIPLSDFIIVAFKGTAKEKLVYGRGKTAFTGGTSGTVYLLSDEEHQKASDELSANLGAKLKEDVLKQIPEGYVLLPDSLSFIPNTQANEANTPSQTSTVTVTYSGTERGILLKKDELHAAFLKAIAAGEEVNIDQVTLRNTEALTYTTTTNITGEFVPKTISFTVSGDISAVWSIDQEAIKKLLAGTKRMVFSGRMQTISSVALAELVIRPFWMNSIPTETEKIKVSIKDPLSE